MRVCRCIHCALALKSELRLLFHWIPLENILIVFDIFSVNFPDTVIAVRMQSYVYLRLGKVEMISAFPKLAMLDHPCLWNSLFHSVQSQAAAEAACNPLFAVSTSLVTECTFCKLKVQNFCIACTKLDWTSKKQQRGIRNQSICCHSLHLVGNVEKCWKCFVTFVPCLSQNIKESWLVETR